MTKFSKYLTIFELFMDTFIIFFQVLSVVGVLNVCIYFIILFYLGDKKI